MQFIRCLREYFTYCFMLVIMNNHNENNNMSKNTLIKIAISRANINKFRVKRIISLIPICCQKFVLTFNRLLTKKTMKKFFLVLLSVPSFIFGQIIFDKAPENFQLFPRNDDNLAFVVFSGSISDNTFNHFKLKVFKNGSFYGQKNIEITNKKFAFNVTIEAGLVEYGFKIYSKREGLESLLFEAKNIVCGDAYIITGQSNSHASSKKATYSNSFARSFGVKTGYEKYSEEDKKIRWGLATGNCKNCKGDQWDTGYDGGWFVKNSHGVGVWGMELAKLLIEKHKIPVCIINGGSGSSTIEENMLYPERISLETSFGRLAYRVDQAGLKNSVRAVFYHQGESDSETMERSLYYRDNFDVLNSDWLRVYKGLEKIYLFQIHPGCGGDFQSKIREIQNQISKKYDHIEIMSTTSILGHDGCHFSYEGYNEFAKRILPLVSRDLFGEKKISVITPPQLMNAYYSGEREITLTFDQKVVIDQDYYTNGRKRLMKDQFVFIVDKKGTLINGVVDMLNVQNKKIIIKLNGDQKYLSISWPPNKEYLNTKEIYNGPWIYGLTNNIGALGFDNRKIN